MNRCATVQSRKSRVLALKMVVGFLSALRSVFRPSFLSISLLVFLAACSPPGDGGDISEPSEYDISIAYLKSLYSGHPIDIRADYRISGYVLSTDRFGNFYKTLVIADETGGIEIKVDMEDLFRDFRFGDEVRVYCGGLTLGSYSGLVQLGTAAVDGYETGYIAENSITAHLSVTGRSPEAPKPCRVAIGELKENHLSRLVRIDDIQFIEEEMGLSWSDPDADTNRRVVDRDGNTLMVRTSRHSESASWLLPPGSGYIDGVLSYFNGEYQLKMSNPHMFEMNGERFDY